MSTEPHELTALHVAAVEGTSQAQVAMRYVLVRDSLLETQHGPVMIAHCMARV